MKTICRLAILSLLIPFASQAKMLNLTSPNGGEMWPRGSVHTITWTSQGVSGTVMLLLFRGNEKIGMIATDIPAGAAAYTWKTGYYKGGILLEGQECQVRIRSNSSDAADISDAPFTIVFAPCEICFMDVLNNRKLKLDSSEFLHWISYSVNIQSHLKLELLQNGKPAGVIFADRPLLSGGFDWKVGQLEGGKAKPGDGYSLRLKTTDGYFTAMSEGTFSIIL